MGDTQWDDSLAGSMVCDADSRLVPHDFVKTNHTGLSISHESLNFSFWVLILSPKDEIIVFINCGKYGLVDNSLNLVSDMGFDGGNTIDSTYTKLNKLLPGEYLMDLHFREISVADGPEKQRLLNAETFHVKDDGLITVRFAGWRPLVCGVWMTQEENIISEFNGMVAHVLRKQEETGFRYALEYISILAAIKLLPLSTKTIKNSDSLRRLEPLRNSRNNMLHSRSSEPKKLFDMLRQLCGKRVSREISSSQWIRMYLVIRKLIVIPELADSDLSFGRTMGVTLDFVCEEGIKEVRGHAQILCEKMTLDQERKIIGRCVEALKSYSDSLKRRMFVGFYDKKSVSDSLRLILSLPSNYVRDALINAKSIHDLKMIAKTANYEIHEMAMKLNGGDAMIQCLGNCLQLVQIALGLA
ncbi:unnamed protein product [Arabis nemorensis]|uniref:Uncharacterized protein n=1 Tax=Arabis nemorensis TaxID=586526 RepID=A0A565C503_9BRAS|nr:unnamed protein product [Arabis nemorensis]